MKKAGPVSGSGRPLPVQPRVLLADFAGVGRQRIVLLDRIRIEIEDNGPGMDEETMAHLFDPFFTTKGKEGNGIGLSSVLSIIERHGGAISVDSRVGNGTIFTLILPLRESITKQKGTGQLN